MNDVNEAEMVIENNETTEVIPREKLSTEEEKD